MLWGLRMPSPLPMGEPSGMTAAQPTCWSRKARTGSSVVYGSTTNPSSASCSAAASSSTASGSSVRSSPITSSLTQSVPNASRASLAVSTASRGRGAPGRVGQDPDAQLVEQVEQRAPARRVDPPHGHGGHGRARRHQRRAQDARGSSCPRCPAAAARPAPRRRCDRPSCVGAGRRHPDRVVAWHRTTIPRCPPMVARCRALHPTDGADHRRVRLGRRGRARRPTSRPSPPTACTAPARSPRSPRRTRPRCAASWPSSPASSACRSRRSSTTSPCAASRPACWPTRRIVGEVAALAAAGTPAPAGGRPGPRLLQRARLMEPDGVAAYLERLLPHALVVTPNLREAAVLGRHRRRATS